MTGSSLVLLFALVASAVAEPSAIQKVVKLITEMKGQTEKEATEDLEAYDKYKCWCESTEGEKTADIKAAAAKIEELTTFIEEAAAKEGELKTEISGLIDDATADQDALNTAMGLRASDNEDFQKEEADMKETLGLLGEAITVLAKVQLLQKGKAKSAALVQVHSLVQRITPKFGGVMQKDLYDMLGAFQGDDEQTSLKAGAFLGEAAPGGAAAGAKSHNSRSGGIIGLLKAQEDEFSAKLAASQKQEATSLADFNSLKAAKLGEIAAATKNKDQKELDLADLKDKAAKAKETVEATKGALSADQNFLVEAVNNCRIEDEEYAKRVTVRSMEIKALGETLDILTGDEARALFDKTISFVQVGSNSNSAERAAAQEKATTRAMQRIVQVARKNRNWQLASLAVHVKLDAFTKVQEAMDKMLVQLKAQQKQEYSKWESCKADIDVTEDKIKEKSQTKADLGATHKDLSNTLAEVANEIERLSAEVSEMQVALKEAGEQRKAANGLYQTTMSDQRAMIAILNMALGRLKEFYAPKLVQVHAHDAAAPPPKPSSSGYEKSGSSGGVLQLITMIIADAERTETEIQAGEQKAQEEYAAFVQSTTTSIEADRVAIEDSSEQSAKASSSKSETEEGQLANDAELTKLGEFLGAVHGDCDFLLKYFDVRQKARAEEMDAIEDAKAILSGANFA